MNRSNRSAKLSGTSIAINRFSKESMIPTPSPFAGGRQAPAKRISYRVTLTCDLRFHTRPLAAVIGIGRSASRNSRRIRNNSIIHSELIGKAEEAVLGPGMRSRIKISESLALSAKFIIAPRANGSAGNRLTATERALSGNRGIDVEIPYTQGKSIENRSSGCDCLSDVSLRND